MSEALFQIQPKFYLDYEKLTEKKLFETFKDRISDLHMFHVQTALIAFQCEKSKRYTPDPRMYISDFPTNIMEAAIGDSDHDGKDLASTCNERSILDHLPNFFKWHYFTFFTCDLKLFKCTKFGGIIFIVRQNDEKEKQFKERDGDVSYCFHATEKDCVYSICRNGIKAFDVKDKFCSTGATHGKGIYMSKQCHQRYGSISLCYAVKNADEAKIQSRSDHYLFKEEDIILRAILWEVPPNLNRSEFIKGIKKMLHTKKHK